ncbi:hypothetical protein BDV25DRAFT_154708 [Aspergillus avenaceus]|uniref:Uncharacterized protein n=1 Tax=Aspergillus avenaceus TaxID=36643 RepID=A0A5N6TV97_ASPAV|nr:hypothetical protein BDV25DRAFT_154708 [Aspergillus avenaceus]
MIMIKASLHICESRVYTRERLWILISLYPVLSSLHIPGILPLYYPTTNTEQ